MSLTLAQETEIKQDRGLVLAESQITIAAPIDENGKPHPQKIEAIAKYNRKN